MKTFLPFRYLSLLVCLCCLQSVFSATEISVNWNYGYVGSSSNSGYKNKLNTNGKYYSYSDVITLKEAGTKIYFTDNKTGFASAAAYVISSWKKNSADEWVIDLDSPNYPGTGSAYSDIARPEGSQVTYVYISSKANENIRLCYRSEQTTTSTPVFPKVYTEATSEPGTAQIKDNLNEWITTQKESINFTQLEGKTLYALGDSYFAGNGLDPEYVWVSILAKKYNMAFTNYGINGSTVSNFITTKNPMCERYTNMASTAPDIVLVEGGRNDYNNSVPVGTVDSHDTKTFMGALNVTIEGLKTKYPQACIICTTVWKYDGTVNDNTYLSFAQAMEQVAQHQNVYCFKAYDPTVSTVDMTDASFRSTYCMSSSDVSHLNLEGHKRVLPKFESFIAECYDKFTNASAVSQIANDAFKVQATKNGVHITATQASQVIVYDITGKIVLSEEVKEGDNAFTLPTGAVYIASINGHSYKVCL